MKDKVMKVEEIDAHIQKHAQARGLDICATYTKVKPVLVFAKGLLFFKPNWQAVLQSLIDALDKECGG